MISPHYSRIIPLSPHWCINGGRATCKGDLTRFGDAGDGVGGGGGVIL